MKNFPFVQPLVQRWRESPSGVIAPSDARRPFRLWMTGSLAVVMAAMIPLRAASETERSHALRVLRHSRFGVSETLQRIEVAAAPDADAPADWSELPLSVVDELQALPDVVERALG